MLQIPAFSRYIAQTHCPGRLRGEKATHDKGMSEVLIKRKMKRVRSTETEKGEEDKKGASRQILLYKKDDDDNYQWGVVESESETGFKLTNALSIEKKDVKKSLSLNFQKAIAGYIEGEKEFRPSRFLTTHTVKLVSTIRCTH